MSLSSLKKRLSEAMPKVSPGSSVGLSALLGGAALGKGVSVVGLDIGSRRIKAAVLSMGERGVVVEKVVDAPVPPAMASGGTILDPEGLTEELARLFAEAGIKKPRVTIMVGGSDTFVRRLSMPRMSYQEALRTLPQNQSLRLPIDPANNKIDLYIIDPTGEGNAMQAIVVAAKKESVITRQKIVLEAGAALHAVDVDAFALFNVFEHCHGDLLRERATLVDIGYEKSLVVVVDKRAPTVARHAYVGVSHLIEHMGSSNLLPDEAERILRSSNPPAMYSDPFRAWSDLLLEEVRRSAGGGRGDAATGPIYLSGGGANIDGLASFLRDRVGGPVSVFDPLASIQTGDGISLRGDGDATGYALAIGLGLRQVV